MDSSRLTELIFEAKLTQLNVLLNKRRPASTLPVQQKWILQVGNPFGLKFNWKVGHREECARGLERVGLMRGKEPIHRE